MGSSKGLKIRPSWTLTLGSMIDDYALVSVHCDRCRGHRVLSREALIALAEKVGRAYSLWNRRCKCRLTSGCPGWNKFNYQGHGCMRIMMEERRLDAICFE